MSCLLKRLHPRSDRIPSPACQMARRFSNLEPRAPRTFASRWCCPGGVRRGCSVWSVTPPRSWRPPRSTLRAVSPVAPWSSCTSTAAATRRRWPPRSGHCWSPARSTPSRGGTCRTRARPSPRSSAATCPTCTPRPTRVASVATACCAAGRSPAIRSWPHCTGCAPRSG